MIIEISDLGLELCKDFVIILVDYPERFNWLLHNFTSRGEAAERYLQIGFEKKQGYNRALRKIGLHEKVSIWSWLRFIERSGYQRNKKIILDFFFSNKLFYREVIKQVNKKYWWKN